MKLVHGDSSCFVVSSQEQCLPADVPSHLLNTRAMFSNGSAVPLATYDLDTLDGLGIYDRDSGCRMCTCRPTRTSLTSHLTLTESVWMIINRMDPTAQSSSWPEKIRISSKFSASTSKRITRETRSSIFANSATMLGTKRTI